MLTRHLTTKILDIRLEEEKFYFPGETIKGKIIVHPKSTIKVNCINLKFSGEVYIHLKEKELNTLFQDLLVLPEPKQTTLDSGVDHAFPFEFIVPKHLNLPSSMEFGKKGHIRYTITAVLDRPMLLESLCPKVDYVVSLLEYIDIEREQFKIPQEKSQDLMLPQAKYNQKCMVRASMPRLGFTRGDIVPLKVTIDHFTSYSRKDGVTVELVRTVEIRTLRHTVFKETALRKTPYLLDIKSPAYSQSILCQLLIPTSTPPSLRYKDKVLRFHYKVRVTVHFGDGSNSQIILDMPIVVGTWPRASVPIEDDDDTLDMEDSIQSGEEEEDVTDDTDIESLRTCSIEDNASRRSSTGWNNSSNITLNGGGVSNNNRNSSSIIVENTLVGRSDSVASKASNRSFNSISSWKSSRSWDQQQQQQPYYPYHQQYNHSANSLSRNTSSASHHQSHHRSSSIYSNDSSTLYPNSVSSNTNNINRHSAGSSTSNGSVTSLQQQQQQFYNRQLPPTMGIVTGYGGYGNGGHSNNNPNRLSRYSNRHEDDSPATPTSIQLENDVPTHILEPISSPNPPATTNTSATGGFVPLTSPIHELQESDYNNTTTQPTTSSCNESLSSLSPSEDEDEDDSDEDDLLAIIERKKKKERRDLKKKRLAEKKAAASATVPPVVMEAADNA